MKERVQVPVPQRGNQSPDPGGRSMFQPAPRPDQTPQAKHNPPVAPVQMQATEGSIGERPPQHAKDMYPTNPVGAPACRPHDTPWRTKQAAQPPLTLPGQDPTAGT
ncbi:hypothetical protein CRENBAI_013468 [Crenichthys baileyi]|uniref:Uncharacterized protein n=1 Tax=Crenichthys baileyi TaxID=28760 RepID=A0AAV9SJI8_9TELE